MRDLIILIAGSLDLSCTSDFFGFFYRLNPSQSINYLILITGSLDRSCLSGFFVIFTGTVINQSINQSISDDRIHIHRLVAAAAESKIL
jgi:hypothetical protein